MDRVTLIGLFMGLGALIGGFIWEGGNAMALVAGPAALIVFGGTIGATVLSFTADELRTVPRFFKLIFTSKEINYYEIIDMLADIADKARRDGLLSLESKIAEIENPYLARGLQLVIDGSDPELTKSMMEMELEAFEQNEKIGYDIFIAAGGFAPTMGIIGTVMGMVHILSDLSAGPEKLASAIGLAFLAALYGVSLANVILIPFGNKIKVKTEKELVLMDLILEGILSIQAGENHRVIREKLTSFVPKDIQERLGLSVEQQRIWM